MNIFFLDEDIKKCARYHCDQHVVKMILESAQILCTVCNLQGIETPYKSTHIHHPCVLWAQQSIQNWRWLKKLAQYLNEEYRYRFDHSEDHRSYTVIKNLSEPTLPDIGLTERPQAMPKEYQVPNSPQKAYRAYYCYEKKFATWKKRSMPTWYKTFLKNELNRPNDRGQETVEKEPGESGDVQRIKRSKSKKNDSFDREKESLSKMKRQSFRY